MSSEFGSEDNDKSKTNWIGWIIAVLTFLLVMFGVGSCITIDNRNQQQEYKDLCKELKAEFRSEPTWICVRDGEVVYPVGGVR